MTLVGPPMASWSNPIPTDIDGISYVGPDFENSGAQYAVTFTLYVDAADPDQASERAMQMRLWFVLHDADAPGPEYYWHLHDHDGC